MARTAIPLYVTNQVITAAHGNTYWRANEAAHWPYTADGDIAYRSAVDALATLAIGADGGIMESSGAAPAWSAAGGAGSVMYNNGAATPAWLALGTAGQVPAVNAGATAPAYRGIMEDWQELTVADWTSGVAAAYQTVPNSTITLTLAVPCVVHSEVTCNLDSNGVGDFASLRTYIDGDAGDGVQTESVAEYMEIATVTHMKACAAGNIDCDIRIYGEGANTAAIQNAQITAWAIPGS